MNRVLEELNKSIEDVRKQIAAKQAELSRLEAARDQLISTGVPRKVVDPAKASTNENVAAGRRAVASGERPTIRDSILQVLGDRVMNADEIIEGLQVRGLMPHSKKPKQYIQYVISDNKDVFERAGWGKYRAKGVTPKTSDDVEDKLAALGIRPGNVAVNPFPEA